MIEEARVRLFGENKGMTQPLLDWSADVSLPVAGKTPRTRHASASGAIRAAKDRGALAVAYIGLLKATGPLSDHQAAHALGRLVSSINSTRNGLGVLIVDSGEYEDTAWRTRRTKWSVAK
jgi:hypothetical protein